MPLKQADVVAALARGKNQKLPDGRSLYLLVRNGRGYWVFHYREGKAIQSKGFGSATEVSVAEARRRADAFRALRNGTLPPPPPVTASPLSAAVVGASPSFGEAVTAFILDRAADWKGGPEGKEAAAYRRTLLGSSLAALPVPAIDTAEVLAAIKPLPGVTREKTRVRVSTVLDWCKAMGYRTGENPARRRGHMEHLLPAKPKAKHHAAVPWADVPALIRELQADGSAAAQALQWTVVTAARTGETLQAERGQIKGGVWVCPPSIMKEEIEHRVPLTAEALALIEGRKGRLFPIGKNAMLELLTRLRPGFTTHGLRSSFGDWAVDNGYPRDLADVALAHKLGDDVQQAYIRTDVLSLRRKLMEAWSAFIFGGSARRDV